MRKIPTVARANLKPLQKPKDESKDNSARKIIHESQSNALSTAKEQLQSLASTIKPKENETTSTQDGANRSINVELYLSNQRPIANSSMIYLSASNQLITRESADGL